MSDQKCFCHITDKEGNTYHVKDAEAREEIEKLKQSGGSSKLYRHNIRIYRDYYEHVAPEHQNGGGLGTDLQFEISYVHYSSSRTPMTIIDLKPYVNSLHVVWLKFEDSASGDAPWAYVSTIQSYMGILYPLNSIPYEEMLTEGTYTLIDTVTEV